VAKATIALEVVRATARKDRAEGVRDGSRRVAERLLQASLTRTTSFSTWALNMDARMEVRALQCLHAALASDRTPATHQAGIRLDNSLVTAPAALLYRGNRGTGGEPIAFEKGSVGSSIVGAASRINHLACSSCQA